MRLIVRLLPAIAVVGAVVFAGCGVLPFGEPAPQAEPAPVMLVNNTMQTETFTVGVVGEKTI